MHKRYVNMLVVVFVCAVFTALGADGYLSSQTMKVRIYSLAIDYETHSIEGGNFIDLTLLFFLCVVRFTGSIYIGSFVA